MARTGKCLCGAITYEITSDVSETGVCHCSMCRRWSGGVYLAVEVPADGLTVTGEVQTYPSSDWAERCFCGKCGSSLWYRLTMPGPQYGTHHLAFGTLDDPRDIEMLGEIYIDHKPDTYSFAGDHRRQTEAEFLASIGITEP